MLLHGAPLYFPKAKEWMWNYCIYLGPFTDSEGKHYDLGCFINQSGGYLSNATVYGNKEGDYISGPLYLFDGEVVEEVKKRAEVLKIIG